MGLSHLELGQVLNLSLPASLQTKWETGDRLIFQQYNVQYANRNVDRYWCFHHKLEVPLLMLNYIAALETMQSISNQCPLLTHLQQQASNTSWLHMDEIKACSLMLLTNLAEPQWISVPCDEALLPVGICVVNRTSTIHITDKNTENVQKMYFCHQSYIQINTLCYDFLWGNVILKSTEVCNGGTTANTDNILIFQHIYNSISIQSEFPLVIVENYSRERYLVRFYKTHSLFKYYENITKYQEGFHTCKFSETELIKGNNIFQCLRGGYISFKYVCDGAVDCPNCNSDESYFCMFVRKEAKSKCSRLFEMNKNGSCQKYVQEPKQNRKFTSTNQNRVPNDNLFNNKRVTDVAADMHPLNNVLRNKIYSSCQNPAQIPCFEGNQTCYSLKNVCMYELNVHNQIKSCKNGGHLENCKACECSITFKCPESYCIPWSYVCDGKWDCIGGHDEIYQPVCGKILICEHMYKCKNMSNLCLHLGEVCDGHKNCPFGDDELLCNLKSVTCPSKCTCLIMAIDCKNVSAYDYKRIGFYTSVYISNSLIYSLSIIQDQLISTKVLKLPSNSLFEFCNISPFKEILLIDLSFNSLRRIGRNCFVSHKVLKVLLLNNNKIEFIALFAITNLTNLLFFNLSNNPICNFPWTLLKYSQRISSFGAVNLNLTVINLNSRNEIIKVIDTDSYHLCCVASYIVCLADRPWFAQCSYLLPSKTLDIVFILVSCLITFLNIESIVLHLLTWKANKVFSVLVISLNVGNLVCASYFWIIWISNFIIEQRFLTTEETWKSFPICLLSFGCVLLFTFLNQLLQISLSLSRLMIVIHPLYTKFKNLDFILKLIFYIFIVSSFVTISVCIFLIATGANVTNNLCLPFIDPSDSILPIKILTWFVVTTQSTTSMIIMLMHISIYNHKEQFSKILRKSEVNDNFDAPLIMQLIIITLSNFLSWFPANSIYVLAMFLPSYSIGMVMWTIVFVMPTNCIVIPTVLNIMAVRKWLKSRDEKKT